MPLQDKLKIDLKLAMKTKDEATKEAIRVVMGEMARLDKKTFSDDEIISILKKLLKSETEMLERSGQPAPSPFMQAISAYLPRQATDAQIRDWIAAHIDFTAYKNKMQAMGTIMQHFGSSADGNRVKQILLQLDV
jgi:uncharacterized protein YqeY